MDIEGERIDFYDTKYILMFKIDEEENSDEEEEIDIDLEDPEVGKAALKIQSSFRGHQARKEVETMKDNKEAPTKVKGEEEEPANEEDIDIPSEAIESEFLSYKG